MKYCTKCGKILANSFEDNRERRCCKTCGHIVYQNPIPVAVVIAFKDEKILLIKRANDPLGGYWAPPSGYIEIDETLEEGAAREVLEETGYEVKIDNLIGVYSKSNMGVIFTVYRGHITGGHPRINETESLDVKLFALKDIPGQNPPEGSAELDRWFFDVISVLLASLNI